MKRSKLFLSLSTVALISLCSCQSNLQGAYVFMHKQSGNAYGMSVYKGVSEYLDTKNIKHADKSPSEQAVSNQVQMIENAAMLGAKAVIVSSSGEVGYDNVLKRVTEKGMKIVSVDSPISPKYRTMHVDQCDPQAIGSFVARSSVCIGIAQRLVEKDSLDGYQYAEFPDAGDPTNPDKYDESKLFNRTKEAIDKFIALNAERKINIAIITSTAASPSQNEWIKAMQEELNGNVKYGDEAIDYSKVVDVDWMNNHIALGLDESVESTNKANALIEGEGKEKCDVIANVTSVACAACGEALSVHYKTDEKYKHVKMTGLGMPSEMWTYMPSGDDGEDVKALDFPCPYACLWNVPDMGYVAAQIAERAVTLNPEPVYSEDTPVYYHLSGDEQEHVTYPVKNDDGSLKLQPLDPLPFYRANIDDWKGQF